MSTEAFPGVKWRERLVDPSPFSKARLQMGWNYISAQPSVPDRAGHGVTFLCLMRQLRFPDFLFVTVSPKDAEKTRNSAARLAQL
jgi:hypothetical protein